MTDVCIIGWGVVGEATAKVFGITKFFDINADKSNITLKEAARCRFIFMCLPTPVKDGQYDQQAITETIRQLDGYNAGGIVVNRSTVTPGTARNLQSQFNVPIVANPEFLTQSSAEYDAKHPDFILIGADLPHYAAGVRGLYEARFKGTDILETDTITAEMAKVSLNAFFVNKVVFANTIYDICQRNGANYEKVKETITKHKYGSKNHFDIFHKGGRGAGGRCLEKDFDAFRTYCDESFLSQIYQKNKYLLETYPKKEE